MSRIVLGGVWMWEGGLTEIYYEFNNWATACLPYDNWVVDNNTMGEDLGGMID